MVKNMWENYLRDALECKINAIEKENCLYGIFRNGTHFPDTPQALDVSFHSFVIGNVA